MEIKKGIPILAICIIVLLLSVPLFAGYVNYVLKSLFGVPITLDSKFKKDFVIIILTFVYFIAGAFVSFRWYIDATGDKFE